MIADRITLVRSNAAKAHDDLVRIAAEALAKDGADAAAIETDRARLYAEVRTLGIPELIFIVPLLACHRSTRKKR